MIQRPHILKLDDGAYQVTVLHTSGDGSTIFRFSDIEYIRRSEVNSFVEASVHIGDDIVDYSGRLNLSSTSGRESFARAMARIAKNKQEFDSYLSGAIIEVMRAIQSEPTMIDLIDAPEKKEKQWLLEPFILDKAPNILFGEGGGGKTFVAIRMLLSIATGLPFLDVMPGRKAVCMFLDYEDEGSEAKDRLMKLCSSKMLTLDGKQPELEDLRNIKYFPAKGIPIHDLVPQLKEKIKLHKIEFILIDSALMACGGEPEKADAAGRFFNALAKLDVTTLTIAHETKNENHEHVFGSIFWRNCTRNMWNAQSEKSPVDSRQISFGLFHRKCNHAALRAPISLRMSHGDNVVDIVKGSPEEWGGKALTVGERIVRTLRTGPKQFGQIVEALNMEEEVKRDVITTILTRLKTRNILKQSGKDDMFWEIA